MRLPVTTTRVLSLARGRDRDDRPEPRVTPTVSPTVSRTAVLPGQSPLWRPPTRLYGLLERYDRMTPVLP